MQSVVLRRAWSLHSTACRRPVLAWELLQLVVSPCAAALGLTPAQSSLHSPACTRLVQTGELPELQLQNEASSCAAIGAAWPCAAPPAGDQSLETFWVTAADQGQPV